MEEEAPLAEGKPWGQIPLCPRSVAGSDCCSALGVRDSVGRDTGLTARPHLLALPFILQLRSVELVLQTLNIVVPPYLSTLVKSDDETI